MNSEMEASGRRDPAEDGRPSSSVRAQGTRRRPVFVLNLKRHSERLKFMKRQLDGMNLDFEIVEAVDGALIPAEEREKLVHGSEQRPADQIGTLLSHLKAYQAMVERNISEALILEDDMEFNEDAAEVLNAVELPAECRILQLAGIKDEFFEQLHVACYPGGVPLPRGYAMSPRAGVLYGALAYIIRLSYARRLLQEATPLRASADNLLFHFHSNLYLPWAVWKRDAGGRNLMLGEEKRFSGSEDKSKWKKRRWRLAEARESFAKDGAPLPPRKPGKPPPVFVIDLKQDPQSLAAIKQRLDQDNIPFQVIEAEERKERISGENADNGVRRDPLSPPDIDRCLSHLKAYRAALRTGAPEAVILEDDVLLEENFAAWLRGEGTFRMANTAFRQWHFSGQIISPHRVKPLAHGSDSARQEKIMSDFTAMKCPSIWEAILYCYARAYVIPRPRMRRLLSLLKKDGVGGKPLHRLLFYPAPDRPNLLRRALNPEKRMDWLQSFLLRHPEWLHHEEKLRIYELGTRRFRLLRELIVILSCYSFFPARWRRRPAKAEDALQRMPS